MIRRAAICRSPVLVPERISSSRKQIVRSSDVSASAASTTC
jgi:hypothetical protein